MNLTLVCTSCKMLSSHRTVWGTQPLFHCPLQRTGLAMLSCGLLRAKLEWNVQQHSWKEETQATDQSYLILFLWGCPFNSSAISDIDSNILVFSWWGIHRYHNWLSWLWRHQSNCQWFWQCCGKQWMTHFSPSHSQSSFLLCCQACLLASKCSVWCSGLKHNSYLL